MLLLKVFRLHKVIVHFLFIFLLFFESLNNTTQIKDIIKELYELIHYSSFHLRLFYLFNRSCNFLDNFSNPGLPNRTNIFSFYASTPCYSDGLRAYKYTEFTTPVENT